MKVGRFNISDLARGEGGLNCLSFGSVGKQGDFDLASFREKTREDDNKQPNSDYPQRNPTPNPKENNNNPANQTPKDSSTLKTVLIVGGIVIGLILVSFTFYL
jgi:hypothetical protein